MLLHVLHRTTFVYAGPVRDSFNEVRLHPVSDVAQQCLDFALRLTPAVAPRDYPDLYGNTVHYFDVVEPHAELVIEAVSRVQTTALADRPAVPVVGAEAFATSPELYLFAEFLNHSHYVPLDARLSREAQAALADGPADVWTNVRRLGHHVYRTLAYKPRSTGVDTRATEALELRAGVCQDFAHVHLGLCRSAGIPARYVSGYFFNDTRRPDEVEASHAWIEAYVPGHGWAAYDPTHDRIADERYVKVATGRDYADIRPVNGTYRGPPTRSLTVEVAVRQSLGG